MAKIATVKFSWTKSPSTDVTEVKSELTANGAVTTASYGPEVESFTVDIQARSGGMLKLTVVDGEGRTTDAVYTWSIGDLEDPLPVTNIRHEILSVRDV